MMTNPDQSLIRHPDSHHIDTFRDDRSSGEEVPVTTTMIGQAPPRPNGALTADAFRLYLPPMATSTADSIAAALRERLLARLGYLPDRKLHALLYLAQGTYLAVSDGPLFDDPITATETGVMVASVTGDGDPAVPDPVFGHVVFTAGRYGGLSAMDLEALIRGQGPWSATKTGREIDQQLIAKTFQEQDDTAEGTLLGYPRSVRAKKRRADDIHTTDSYTPDSREEIEAFIADVQAGL